MECDTIILITSRVVQWLGYLAFTQEVRVRFPAWENNFLDTMDKTKSDVPQYPLMMQ